MSHSQGRTFFRVPSNTFMEFVVKRIRGWRWEKVALITHNKMWGRTFSPKGKKALLPSDLLRGCTMECIRWSRIAFPVLFFFFLFFFFYLPLRGLLSGGSAGAREGTISPYSYPDSILMPKPGPNGQHLLRQPSEPHTMLVVLARAFSSIPT